ncbi:dual-specificity kinase [Malassezia vespertilionis]|uniref:dual-specificity kinase n=1 Tax=Malassezia vespertilionis TaxID=2020962 RepID=A0A2N1JBF3_9BASI|nr:dual-specificity kinase [Malassezia vespertilionis]PKI83878.1 hypothetical protein MVES_002234 [Malassezia vespertilionis]WFD07012.1 dual-specificity kinase [Malassezia vespertilionis]
MDVPQPPLSTPWRSPVRPPAYGLSPVSPLQLEPAPQDVPQPVPEKSVYGAPLPQTPAQYQHAVPLVSPDTSLAASPRGYDRTEQVGLGELATPRWTADDRRSVPASVNSSPLQTRLPPSSPAQSVPYDYARSPGAASASQQQAARQARAMAYTVSGSNTITRSETRDTMPSFTSVQQLGALHVPTPDTNRDAGTTSSTSRRASMLPVSASISALDKQQNQSTGTRTYRNPPTPSDAPSKHRISSGSFLPSFLRGGRGFLGFGTADVSRKLDGFSVSPRNTHTAHEETADQSTQSLPARMLFPQDTSQGMPGGLPLADEDPFQPTPKTVHPDTGSLASAGSRVPSTGQSSSQWSLVAENHDTTRANAANARSDAVDASERASLSTKPSPTALSTPSRKNSARSARSRTFRQSMHEKRDEDDDSGSLAGRLSRRSLGAIGNLFKSSPKRAERASGEHDDELEKPKSRSRLSFSRWRRQSVSGKSVHDAPAMPTAPSLPPKSTLREENKDAVPPMRADREEPSAYYAAKAQGSRIPRPSSMMRLLSSKPGDTGETRARQTPSRLPQSISMHTVRSDSQSTRIPSTPSYSYGISSRASSIAESEKRAETASKQRRSPAKREELKPTKVRTLRRAQNMEATDALQRQRALQASTPSRVYTRKAALVAETSTPSGLPRSVSRQSQLRAPSVASVPLATVRAHDASTGDAEIERHIQRVQQRKLAGGMSQADLDKQLEYPAPVAPSKRLSARQAEVIYGNHLCPYELQELHEYESIYYVGSFARHKHYAVPDKPDRNYGYDDERGDYELNLRDHLAFRYEIVKLLGRGSFGQVLQCKDHKTGHHVAVKLIRNKRRFHKQALVEVNIMEHLTRGDPNDEHNVVHMSDSFTFRGHLCVTMELLGINLYELIKANSFEGFSCQLIRRFASQTLACLALMQSMNIVHCDLKPENILLTHPRKSGIKVIDYGSSCFENGKVYTYIQSRFYRSPEVILGMDYTVAIDMWSLGCILAELHTGYPIFPGENEQDQLACIMEVLGMPDRHLLEQCSRRKLFFDSTGTPRPVVNSRGHRRRPNSKSLAQAVRSNNDLFLDFIARCLIWDPERRLKADAALRHPWFTYQMESALPRPARRPKPVQTEGGPSLLPRAAATKTATTAP